MISEYRDEKTSIIKYFTSTELERNKLTIKNGKFYDCNNELYTSFNPALNGSYRYSALYVIDKNGDIYVTMKRFEGLEETMKIHHSSLLSGKPVLCAGFISIHEGKLNSISNASGHYQPDLESFLKTLAMIRAKRVNMTSVKVQYITPGTVKLKTFSSAIEFWRKLPYSQPSLKRPPPPIFRVSCSETI